MFGLSTWKLIIVGIIVGIIALIVVRWNMLQGDLKRVEDALKIEKSNNAVLRNNIDQITVVNKGNLESIEKLKKDKEESLKAISKLNKDVTGLNRSTTTMKERLSTMNTPAVPLSHYIIEGVNAVQKLRDEQLPTAIVTSPAEASKTPPKKVTL